MAQTNFTPILTYKSDTATSVPSAGNLTNSANGAELAVNTADKRLFTKDSGGSVVEVGTNPSSLTLPNSTANGVFYSNGSKVVTSGSALVFDGSNLGLGVTPSAWGGSRKALQIGGNTVSTVGLTNTIGEILYNNFFNGTNFIYSNTGYASSFDYNNATTGGFAWRLAPSGTAGNAITFTQAMTLDASGNLGVGTTSPAFKLDVNGDAGITASESYLYFYSNYSIGNNSRVRMRAVGAGGGSGYGGDLRISTRASNNSWNTDAFVVDSSANVGIGTSAPLSKFDVAVEATLTRRFLVNYDDSLITIKASNNSSNPETFRLVADNFRFNTGTTGSGTEKMRLDLAGNLGLGVTPSAWTTFKVMQLGNFGAIGGVDSTSMNMFANTFYDGAFKYINTSSASRYRMDDGHSWFTAPSGTAGNAITFTQAMTLDANGALLVGSTVNDWVSYGGISQFRKDQNSPSLLTVSNQNTGSSGSAGILFAAYGNSWVNSIGTSAKNGNALTWALDASASPPSEKMRLDTSGNLLVGTTSFGSTAVGFAINGDSGSSSKGACISVINSSVNGNTTYEAYSLSASAYRFYVGMGGTVYATSTTITAISDQRLKENIRDLDEGLATVMALKPRKFDWKAGKGADIKNARGFIAQEFEQVLPDMIEEWRDPAPEGEEPYKAINANLIPTLVKALQEQQAIIESLKARLDAANL